MSTKYQCLKGKYSFIKWSGYLDLHDRPNRPNYKKNETEKEHALALQTMSLAHNNILKDRDGILAIYVRFKPNVADPAEQS